MHRKWKKKHKMHSVTPAYLCQYKAVHVYAQKQTLQVQLWTEVGLYVFFLTFHLHVLHVCVFVWLAPM